MFIFLNLNTISDLLKELPEQLLSCEASWVKTQRLYLVAEGASGLSLGTESV